MKRKLKAALAFSLVVLILAGIVAVSLMSGAQKIDETLDNGKVLSAGSAGNNINGKEYEQRYHRI